MKKLFTLLVIFYFSSMLLSAKENIIIEYFSAEQQELELKQIATIEFTEEYIYFLDRSGDEIASKKIENVRKISFVDGETAVENIADITMIVYPNPTMEALFVQGVQKGDVVRIYTLDGTLLKTQTVEDELLQINVEEIATGSYILQSNTNVVKFIKK